MITSLNINEECKGKKPFSFSVSFLPSEIYRLDIKNTPASNFFLHLRLLHEKFLQFDSLRAVVFQLNFKYLHVKITNLLWVVV